MTEKGITPGEGKKKEKYSQLGGRRQQSRVLHPRQLVSWSRLALTGRWGKCAVNHPSAVRSHRGKSGALSGVGKGGPRE